MSRVQSVTVCTLCGGTTGGFVFFPLVALAKPALRLNLFLLAGATVAGIYIGEVARDLNAEGLPAFAK